jgi:hypothetical protein
MSPPPGKARKLERVCVPLVDECSGDSAWTGVQVLVRAPDGKIDVPVVQMQFNIAGGMRQVKAHYRPDAMSDTGDRLYVERLSGVIVNAAEQYERDRIGMPLDGFYHIVRTQCRFAFTRSELDQPVGRGRLSMHQFVKSDLRFDRILIGRKRAFLDHDLVPCRCRAVERNHHQVQVYR